MLVVCILILLFTEPSCNSPSTHLIILSLLYYNFLMVMSLIFLVY